jgi:hypothetical protein
LDVLNQGSVVDQPELPYDFLLLKDVEITSHDGKKHLSSPSCLLGKNSLVFLGESIAAGGKTTSNRLSRSHLYTQKKALWVEICVPEFLISGQMHVNEWQKSIGAVDTDQRFLPITKAIVSPKLARANIEFEFMVVNRSHISCIVELGN